jgi:two-component system OmpR family response regulator
MDDQNGAVAILVDLESFAPSALVELMGALDHASRPIIALAVEGTASRRVLALDLGAVEVLPWPLPADEVGATLRAVLRAYERASEPLTLRVGDLAVDVLAHRVSFGDCAVRLTGFELGLLCYLATRVGEVVTRNEILDAVWGQGVDRQTNAVERHIASLRAKLRGGLHHPSLIETVHGTGYRLVSERLE